VRPLSQLIDPFVPEYLTTLPQWVAWTLDPVKGKVPKQINGAWAKSNDPTTWSTLPAAIAASHQFDGIGFCFSKIDRLQGADLDACFDDTTGELHPWAKAIVEQFPDSYIEYSPSHKGLHILFFGEPIAAGKRTYIFKDSEGKPLVNAAGKKQELEVFDGNSPRFLTFSGDVYQFGTIVDAQCSIDAVLEQYQLGKFSPQAGTLSEPNAPRIQRDLTIAEIEETAEWLTYIKNDAEGVDYDTWCNIGMGLKDYGAPIEIWIAWSEKSDKHQLANCESAWKSFKRESGARRTIGTVIRLAIEGGFKFKADYFPKTDIGNADRLTISHGHRLRWFASEKRWHAWDDSHWRADNTERPMAYAKETATNIFKTAKTDADYKWAGSSSNKPRLEAMLRVAQPDLAITADMLDSDPWLLNCKNGTIDLRTGTLNAHRQEDYITKLAPVDYEPSAHPPRFRQFLSEIFEGSQPIIDFVQRALGYSLTSSVREQVLFICHGTGSNGKGTLFELMRKVLGGYAMASKPQLLLTQQIGTSNEDVYQLRGSRFVTTSETEEGVKFHEAQLKLLTGGDRLNAALKYGHNTEFDPTHKIWLGTNHLPEVSSQGAAMWRRLRLIPFNVNFDARPDKDTELPEKLEAEYPGILAWLVEGCLKWQAEGLNAPPEVMHATQKYKENEDQLGRFINDTYQLTPGGCVPVANVRDAYSRWCQANGEEALSKKALPARLREKGLEEKRVAAVRMWQGIEPKSEPISDPWGEVV
jgi:putative DNA primase/helicase